jgi:hypothetical protein
MNVIMENPESWSVQGNLIPENIDELENTDPFTASDTILSVEDPVNKGGYELPILRVTID